MVYQRPWKALTLSTTLIFLMLIGGLAGILTKPVKAQPVLTLHMILDNDYSPPFIDAMYAVKDALLAELDIEVIFHFFDDLTIYDFQWYTYWDRPGAPPGWDLGTGEWWVDVGSQIWNGAFSIEAGLPPLGYNIAPYLNPKAERLFTTAEATIDAETRRDLLLKWQELYMHDLPQIPLFYFEIHDAIANWVEGFGPCIDPYFRGNPYSTLRLDLVKQQALHDAGLTKIIPGVLPFAESGTMAATNPMFLINYMEDSVHIMTHDTLYSSSRIPFPDFYNVSLYDPDHADFWKYQYRPVPNLAVDYPIYSADYRTAYIPLRDNVDWVWPNNTNTEVRFNASDVVMTFDAVLDPDSLIWGWADFSPVIESVEYVTNDTLDGLGIIPDKETEQYNEFDPAPYYWKEPYVVQFNLKKPHADFVPLLYNTWGGYILPDFVLGDVAHGDLRSHVTNYDYTKLPGTGPWRIADWVKASKVVLLPNTHYWKNLTAEGFRPFETIDEVIVKIIVDTPALENSLITGEIAWGIWGVSVPKWETWKTTYADRLTCFRYQNPSAHPIYFNLNNPELANRYLRLAMTYALPYSEIFTIVEEWGGKAIPMKSIIMPQHFYTDPDNNTVRFYNTDIPAYGTDLTKARYYMDLYLNQTSITPMDGPLGDADQSGLVNLNDWVIWRTNFGATSSPIDIYPTWPFTIDPDWDNDGDVDVADETLWKPPYYGTEY